MQINPQLTTTYQPMWMQFEMDGFKDKNVETYDDRSVDGGGVGDITMPQA